MFPRSFVPLVKEGSRLEGFGRPFGDSEVNLTGGLFMNEYIDSTMGRIHICSAVLLTSDDPRTSCFSLPDLSKHVPDVFNWSGDQIVLTTSNIWQTTLKDLVKYGFCPDEPITRHHLYCCNS